MTKISRFALGVIFGALCLVRGGAACAQGAQATPAPSPTPRTGSISVKVDAHTTFVSEGTRGPGITPPEGPAFAAGSPQSPLTPYDTFSSAPLTPGNAMESALYVTPTYHAGSFDVSATAGAGYVTGSTTVASYWGESIFPTINPHLGFQQLPYRISFPTQQGQDDGTAFAASILSGAVATHDGRALIRGGWFNLEQSDSFVFAQPAITNVPPDIGFATAETLGTGPPNLDAWQVVPPVLPLRGIDGTFKQDLATLELSDASLPSLPGTGAQVTMGSFVIDHGEGTRYSTEVVHVVTGGALVPETVLYGSDATTFITSQGWLPLSKIGGQWQWIFGARAAVHVTHTVDGVAEYGHSTYNADDVAEPGTGKAGNYEHLGLTQNVGRWNYGVDVYRNEPYYAQALLPYGAPENVWSVAWSWPGQWLKSNYQLINDFPVNINREGYRVHYTLANGPLEIKAIFARFQQIDPITTTNALQTGFVDGFFLPQADAFATLGNQHQYGLWSVWHSRYGDLAVDYDEDTMYRLSAPTQPQDAVSYDAPSYVLSFSHRFSPGVLGEASYGRYGMRGSFAQAFTNVDYAQRVGMTGLEFTEGPLAAALVSLRWSALQGLPTIPVVGPSPAFSGTMLVFEQRVHL